LIPFATQKLVIGIAATMAGIYSADQFLAHLEKRELDAQARHEYETGERLLRDGRDSESSLTQAIAAFRRAGSLNRDDTSFDLALADALTRGHQPQRAVDALARILDKDSNDGPANLLMARAMDAQQDYPGANSYYHRAIYGTWLPNQESQKMSVRIELVHWLAKRGDQKGLLSELILLEPLAAGNPSAAAVARDLPSLYRQAGSTNRAIDAYHTWLRQNPADADAYAGLGETELQSGDFRAARQALDRASELKPDDTTLKQNAGVARTAVELAPTPRWLSSSEKLARSSRILDLAITTASGCPGEQPADSPLFENAQKLLTEKKPEITNEAAERRLDLAETIWNTKSGTCASPPQQSEILSALMRKLAQ